MKYATVALSKHFEHRYKFDALIYNTRKKDFVEATIFLDSGCFNTMIPRHLAGLGGQSLGFKMPNKTHIYQNYFNSVGNYICAQIG